ncbi:MAG TPA: GGDEF domain-containing protein [Candidatus Coprovivens excrementavium]|nr:GGDEF domain-containing protein [Candidatus Coprovivens excrementavium]
MKKMKINKRIVIIIILAILAIAILGIITYKIVNDENKLTVEEKEWITENVNVVQNINVPNNLDIFGKSGNGVFFDFIKSLETEYNLNVNEITYNLGEEVGSGSFKVVYDLDDSDVTFYTEHYVVISKEKINMSNISQLSNRKIGILTSDEKIISQYLSDVNNTILNTYETSTNIFEALESGENIEVAFIPLEENLTSILTSNYYIDFHASDLNKYFIFETKENDTFSSIIKKYFYQWEKENLSTSINQNELNTFVEALSISDKEIDSIQADTYNYGFVDNSPYEVLISGTYGGIVSEYLTRFSEFSNTEFKSIRYKNFAKFTEAIANKKIDLFYNYYNLDSKYQEIGSLMNISFVVVAPEENPLIINSISSLSGETVYVQKNSILERYLTSLGGVKIKTYEDEKDLKKLARKNNVFVLDDEVYNYYKKSYLSDYLVRYSNTLSDTYNFYAQNNETFNLLFTKYIQTLDPKEIKIKGNYNHSYTMRSGTILSKVAKYSIFVIIVFIIILYLVYRSTKRIKIVKKIKKEDKLKYIDQLTSLKNRNYLNENIGNWNKNTIYPQATIIIDLNQVRSINDTLGYEQGDAQIKAAANVLIKTQLDNTDIMRTDGNEYLIYLVGYQEKQVVSYIRKLYKEFKNLPYEHGAAIGYSMITNDMKTIEDSINESVEDMRAKKAELEEE